MATYYKRGKKWYAVVRRKGTPTAAKPFSSKREAQVWARSIESKLDTGMYVDVQGAAKTTMESLIRRYAEETANTKRNAPHEKYGLRLLSKHFGHLKLAELTRGRVAQFRNDRIEAGLAASTVRNNLHLLSAIVTKSINDWGYELPYNPVRRVSKPPVNNARDRRLEGDEEERLLAEAAKHSSKLMRPLIIVALETAMRLGELLSIEWQDINYARREIFLQRTKNGTSRKVPLSFVTMTELQSIDRDPDQPRVFHTWAHVTSFQHTWGRMLRRAGISNLRFHDLRHEAASRFAERGMDVLRIAAITGHRSMQMLKRYPHFRTLDLAAELDRPWGSPPHEVFQGSLSITEQGCAGASRTWPLQRVRGNCSG